MPTANVPFFMPRATSDAEAEEGWQTIRNRLPSLGGFPATARRIYSAAYTHNGKRRIAVVGEKDQDLNEEVIAIFESPQCFMVCTPSRGVFAGPPLLIGEPLWVVDFAA